MRFFSLLVVYFFTILSFSSFGQVWINEIHYDNTGTDTGEGFEIAGPAGTDLSCYTIYLYNGSVLYSSNSTFVLSGIIPNVACGIGTIWFGLPVDGLQNGTSDGIALYNTCTSSLVQFISYEGSITATAGVANGQTSQNLPVTETSSTLLNTSIQLAGTGTNYSDFTWETGVANSYNNVNTNQSFCVSTNTLTFDPTPPNSYTINCNTTAAANIDITTTGTFNAGNSYTIQLSDALGDFTNATVIGSTSSTSNSITIPVTIPIGTAEGTGYRIRIISSNPSIISNDNGFNISIIDNCTITTGALSSNTYSVSCSSGSSGSVSFTTSEAMQPGNVYSVQLSDASGDFTASTTIGTLTSTATSGSINYTIPETTPTGTNYLIRVVSSSPNTLGSSSTPISITLTDGPCAVIPPHMSSVIINSCDPTCLEGFNEIVFGSTGDYSIDVNAANFNFSYGSTFPGTNYTDVLVNNATGINQLNTAAGCPGLFVDATGTTIPENASWMLVYTDICEEALTWSGLCGSGPIYVIFQNDPNWNTSGNFANNPSSTSPIRYYQTAITTTTGNTFTINYTTDGNQYANSDGVFATFDQGGGPATTYGDNNCILSPELLPATTVNLNATASRNGNQITWQTQSEQNNDYFTLLHSTDGYNFVRIKEIEGAGQSNSLLSYSHLHLNPPSGINYYKLRSTDYDGTVYEKGLVSVMVDAESTYYDPICACLIFNEEGNFDLYSIEGKILQNIRGSNHSLPDLKGVVLVRNLRTGTIERLFIP